MTTSTVKSLDELLEGESHVAQMDHRELCEHISKPDFSSIDELLRKALRVNLAPEVDEIVDYKPVKNLYDETFFWGKAIHTINEDPWNPDVREDIATRFWNVYKVDPKICGLSPDILRKEVGEKSEPIIHRLQENFISYVDDNIDDLLQLGKPKELKKVATLLDTEYRKLHKLIEGNRPEIDDMRAALQSLYSGYRISALHDQQVVEYFSDYLELKKDLFLMHFNYDAGNGKVSFDKHKLLTYIEEKYDEFNDDKDDYPAMKFSIAEKLVKAYINQQKDDADDRDPDADEEDDRFLPDI